MDEWLSRLDSMHLRRSELNLLIMDYLISEGFKEAAERFKVEAGLELDRGSDSKDQIDQRIAIRTAIEEGQLKRAIQLINSYYPELIDNNRHLFFKLQQQQLIELVREHMVEEALKFAQEQLSVDGDYLQLPELERTLSLLAFEKPETSPYADLLQTSHRQQLASEINEAILKEQSGDDEPHKPKLITLIKLLLWTQNELERKKIKFSKIIDLANATFVNSDD